MMNNDEMNCILTDIGWQEGKIPILNAENKALQDEVFMLQHNLQNKKNILEDVEERIFSMSQHKKNVEQELQHTQQLLGAVSEDMKTEEHIVKICTGEKGRLRQEDIRMGKECKALKEKINADEILPLEVKVDLEVMAMNGYTALLRVPELECHYQMQFSVIHRTPFFFVGRKFYIAFRDTVRVFEALQNTKFKLGEEIDGLREQLKLDKKELESWLEMTAAKDEDAITLQKYRRMDESKVSELTLQIGHLTEESKNRKNALDAEATETLTAQVALDKIAEVFRRSHEERHDLIRRWENTLKMMHKRDNDIDSLNNQLQILKMEINKKKAQLEEKKFFRQNEMENNKQLENKIMKVEKEAAKYRIEFQEAETQKTNFHDELEALKRIVDRTAADLEGTRSQVAELKKVLGVENKKNELVKEQNADLVEKLRIVSECTMSAKEHADHLENMLKNEEKEQENLNHELQELRALKYRKEQELVTLQNEFKFLEARIKNAQTAIRNMNHTINCLDQDALKQEGLLYNQDLMIETLNQRISRMQGQVNSDDMSRYKAKIEVLNRQLEETHASHKMLEIQLNKLQDDIVKLEVHIKKHSAEMNTLHSKIDELKLYNDSSDKLLKKLITDNQELMVKENMEKLTVKRLRDTLYDKASKVLTQEEWRLQVETTMKERQHEINIHKDMLMSQIKFADVERLEISLEYQERLAKIGKLQNRHDILMVSMAPPDGEEVKSQAYYVIKAAQEKEELQRFGDELDAKICKTEKENRALDNTIKLLNASNENYRKSFNRVPDSGEDVEEKQQVEEKLRSVQEEMRHKRRQARELEQDIKTMEMTLENTVKENETLQEILANKQKQMETVTKELENLYVKIDRIKRQNVRIVNEIRSARKVDVETEEEADIDIRGIILFRKSNITELMKIVQQYNHGGYENLLLYLQQANIPVPSPPGSVGSGSSSFRSSVSSTSSMTGKIKEAKQIALVDVGADFGEEGSESPGSSNGSGSITGGARRGQRVSSSRSVSARRSSSSSASSRSSVQTHPSARSSAASARSSAGHLKR